ncbi:MAG: ATP-binding protein [Fusobacteriaceae bacterium]
MRFRRDSLVFKVVFYNNLAIAISTVTIAFFITHMNMQTKYREIKVDAKEKIIAVKNAYEKRLERTRDELIIESSNFNLITAEKDKNPEEYYQIAKTYRDRIVKKDSNKFYESTVSLLTESGKIVAEAGLISERSKLTLENNSTFEKLMSEDKLLSKRYYLENVDGRIYARLIFTYYISYKKHIVIVTVPLNYDLLQKTKNIVAINGKDKMFLIAGENYYAGDFNYRIKENLIPKNLYQNLEKSKEKYYSYEESLENQPFYFITYALRGSQGEKIGIAGLAISKEDFYREKKVVSMIVMFMVIVFIVLGMSIFTRIFGKMFRPLLDITKAAESIGKGDYNYILKSSDTEFGEIEKLNNSFRKMLREIKHNHKVLNQKNINLEENITRIEAIEKLLLGLHFEAEVNDLIKTLLNAFTSEQGLGYGRAMYFRYSREADQFFGEMSAYKESLTGRLSKGIGRGFDFQINDLDSLIKYIKIPYKGDNLIGKALIERKVSYFNQKGYIFDLGNDLFKSLGINNFMIIPIYSRKRNIGCIVVDYFDSDKTITQEEYELMNLLSMNVSMRIRNKHMEEEKLDRERNFTITRLLERFLNNREIFLNNIENIIERYNRGQRDFDLEFKTVLPTIEKLKKENKIFREYSNSVNNRFEKIEIESIFNEIVNEQSEESFNNGVILSVFNTANAVVYGDRDALKKAFYEIMKNSYIALLKTDKLDKKINVIISKDKNTDKLTIRILDTGIGMTERQMGRIYEPFASLNGDTPGLGLSLVYRIIKSHSGIIKYYSKFGEGTEARITLNIYKGDENL